MSEKSNGKSRTNKGVKGGKKDKIKKNDKENKGDKEENTLEKLLEKITIDTVMDAMIQYKWLVAKSIAIHIIGENSWDKLSEEDKNIIIKKINEIKMKTPDLMRIIDANI